jgi:hypothetical protein
MLEGVLVAKKDFNAPKHEELDVPNLEVIKAMQSLTSKGLVKTQFSWQWYYYVLTPEGVEYLRGWYVDLVCMKAVANVELCLGFTFPPRLCLLHTRRQLVLLVPLVSVKEARVLTVLHAVIARSTERRIAHRQANLGHSLLVLVEVPLGSKCARLPCAVSPFSSRGEQCWDGVTGMSGHSLSAYSHRAVGYVLLPLLSHTKL